MPTFGAMLRLRSQALLLELMAAGPSYREAKGGALRLGRVVARWDEFPGSCVWLPSSDSISTTPSSPGLSQRQRTGVSALHKPVLRALHQSTIVHGENALTLRWECRMCRGPFGFAQGRLFDYVAASLREAATPLRRTFFSA